MLDVCRVPGLVNNAFLKLYFSKLLEFLPPNFEGAEEEPVSEINGTHDSIPFPMMANQSAF